MNRDVFICDAIRTPVGKYGGSLSSIRTDDLAAIVIKAIVDRNKSVDCEQIDDVIMGCANQAGEDNRNVARMALLLAGLPVNVPGVTVNRLCGSGMESVGMAARTIATADAEIIIAGGVESMSRSPYVMNKSQESFDRNVKIYDTTIGWRFVNKKMEQTYGIDSMLETAENLAEKYNITREYQDIYAYNSQYKADKAQKEGLFDDEIIPVTVPVKKGEPIIFKNDEQLRLSPLEKLAALKSVTKPDGTVTPGNSSSINDGAAALLIASENAINKYNLNPICKITGMQSAGVLPRIMGIGPVFSTLKLLNKLNLSLDDFDIIELNEAFAAQVLACLKELNISADDIRLNPQGGAIAIGHPLGMSGARLITTAFHQLKRNKSEKKALCTMCIGVGQGISMVVEKV